MRTPCSVLFAAAGLLAVLGACSSNTQPTTQTTLRVLNNTCAAGTCATVYVVAFPDKQPRTPGGPWRLNLGTVDGVSACLEIPPAASFTVTEEPGGGQVVTRWSIEDSLQLGLTTTPPNLMSSPTTSSFRPASSPGWTIDYPSSTRVDAAPACQP